MNQKFCAKLQILYLLDTYQVGQKVCWGFPTRCYRKTRMRFLVNPVLRHMPGTILSPTKELESWTAVTATTAIPKIWVGGATHISYFIKLKLIKCLIKCAQSMPLCQLRYVLNLMPINISLHWRIICGFNFSHFIRIPACAQWRLRNLCQL